LKPPPRFVEIVGTDDSGADIFCFFGKGRISARPDGTGLG
jgi:hypothetical protein